MPEIKLYKHVTNDLWPPAWVIYLPKRNMLAVFYYDISHFVIYLNREPLEDAIECSYLEFLVVLGMSEKDVADFIRDKMGVIDD
jgi:hypothetical protein